MEQYDLETWLEQQDYMHGETLANMVSDNV